MTTTAAATAVIAGNPLLVVGDGDSHRNSQRRPLGEIERGFCTK